MTTTAPKSTTKNGAKIHRFVNTQNFLKTKFLSVLGSSNDLINEISNRLEISLSQSSCSDPDANVPRDPRLSVCGTTDDDESLDENVIDFESRKVKEQRAREEMKSGCYRQPSLIRHVRCDGSASSSPHNIVDNHLLQVAAPAAHQLSPSSSPSSVANVEPRTLAQSGSAGSTTATSPMREAVFRSGFTAASFDVTTISSQRTDSIAHAETAKQIDPNNISSTTSENDPSESTDTSDPNRCVRTVSQNSVPSMASSLSLDSRCADESPSLAFIRDFVEVLFANSSAITLDQKSEFGSKARTEVGRLSFARLISDQRATNKKVNESTFYSLIQYFAIVLFECCDSEDYSPAKILMNMCFTFFHEVEVPGCEPYREYLYTYLREQPIWQSLRFWNAAIFDALQCERVRSILPTVPIHPAAAAAAAAVAEATEPQRRNRALSLAASRSAGRPTEATTADSGDEFSSSGQSGGGEDDDDGVAGAGGGWDSDHGGGCVVGRRGGRRRAERRMEEAEMHQNISFGQLGTFTCNMHAFGLPRTLCTEFLRKQCVIANLNREQERTLLDNVHRMYNETAKWRA